MEKGLAWVTGASSGIGRGLALALAEQGWRVAVSARSAEALSEMAEQNPGRIFAFPLDVTDLASVGKVAAQIAEALGEVDLAVLNAGTYEPISASDFDPIAFSRTLEVNVMGTSNCLGVLLPAMMARRAGHIAVVASVAGYVGLPYASAYGASKAALINMCQSLRPELERAGIKLNLICPGFVDTPLTKQNDFPMPFLISTDQAVSAIMKGLEGAYFEIAFPWRMVLSMRALSILPQRLRFAITRRMLR